MCLVCVCKKDKGDITLWVLSDDSPIRENRFVIFRGVACRRYGWGCYTPKLEIWPVKLNSVTFVVAWYTCIDIQY